MQNVEYCSRSKAEHDLPLYSNMSGLIEQLSTLRSVGVNGTEKQLQILLRTAGYNVERAINQ